MLEGFRKFILRGNVIDLAVGVIIGAAFTAIVNSLVKDLITPIFGIFGGLPDFSAWTSRSTAPSSPSGASSTPCCPS